MKKYVKYAIPKSGLNLRRFNQLINDLTSVDYHPFLIDLFIFFDRESQDKAIDFYELVINLNIIDKGTLEQKCEFCFSMYDILEQNYLDLYSIRLAH